MLSEMGIRYHAEEESPLAGIPGDVDTLEESLGLQARRKMGQSSSLEPPTWARPRRRSDRRLGTRLTTVM